MRPLPAGWTTAPLDELVEVLDSQRKPVNAKERAQRPGKVPYYGAAGPVGTIDEALFEEPLVLLGEDGVQFFDQKKPKAYLIDGPAWVNNHAHVLRPLTPLVDRRYLKYYLDAFDYNGYANGTTRLKLTKRAMSSIPVALAPRAEQERIAHVLDEAVEALRRQGDELARLHKRVDALWNQLISRTIDGSGPIRQLRELLREPLRNGLSARAVEAGQGVRTFTLTAVTRRDFSATHSKVTVATDEQAEGLWCEAGDVFIQRSNTPDLVGSAAVYRGDPEYAIFPDLLIRVRPSTDLLPDFLEYALRTPSARAYFKRKAQGLAGSMPKISQGVIEAFELPIPQLADQVRIVEMLNEFDSQLVASSRALLRLHQVQRHLVQAALRAAFAGELVPSEVTDEPSSRAVEEISAEREVGSLVSTEQQVLSTRKLPRPPEHPNNEVVA